MTKFINLGEASKVKNPTNFNYILNGRRSWEDREAVIGTSLQPSAYDTVTFIGRDRLYGDVFKAECDGCGEEFTLFFGIKGDEYSS